MWGHLQQDEHFVNCIRDGAEPIISPDDGRKAMQVASKLPPHPEPRLYA
jgi:predicted dehydrogenase